MFLFESPLWYRLLMFVLQLTNIIAILVMISTCKQIAAYQKKIAVNAEEMSRSQKQISEDLNRAR